MLRSPVTPEGGGTEVAQGVSPVVRSSQMPKPHRGDTRCATSATSAMATKCKQYSQNSAYSQLPYVPPLWGLRLIMHPTHRAYALGYSCSTPFGGCLWVASSWATPVPPPSGVVYG